MIEARHLTKRYGHTVAVDEASFVVRSGRVTGFLGPNGAGKSTTMRMILGLDAPSSGSVLIDGQPYRELTDPLRSVGALLDLRARGHDLAVIDVSPLPFTERPTAGLDAIAYDIWAMRRGVVRHALERSGVAIAEWHEGVPFQAVLEEVRAFRRAARHVHA